MSRILVLGDLASTGFGTVTMDLGKALVDRGEDVRFASINEGGWTEHLPDWLVGRVMRFGNPDGWLSAEAAASLVPVIEDVFGPTPWPDRWTPEAALFISDVGGVKVSPLPRFLPEGMPAFHYVPIEGVGLPPLWRQVWTRLMPVAMSEFGATEIEKLIGTRPPVVYHGVDTDIFRPVSPERPMTVRISANQFRPLRSKADCKRFLGLDPNRILLFRADRNVPRKRYPSLLRALAPILARHPDVDFRYHCLTRDQGGDLNDDRSKYGPLIGWTKDGEPAFGGPAGRMLSTGFHDQRKSATREMLAILYNAADIYVSTCSEGFGLTIAEAIACGTPAVALDFSSVPEVVGKAGILVEPGFADDNIYGHFWAGVHEGKFAEAVERLITSRGARRELGAFGPIHVGATFRWSRAAEQFSDLVSDALRLEVAA